eukprot:g1445.t1
MDATAEIALEHLRAGRFAEAASAFSLALQKRPRNTDLLRGLRAANAALNVLSSVTLTTVDNAPQCLVNDVPRFLLLGVMKCGTTALYDYICQHPDVLRARHKETHFFDWRWEEIRELTIGPKFRKFAENALSLGRTDFSNDSYTPVSLQIPSIDNDAYEMRKKYMQAFPIKEMLQAERVIVSGEATPSYLLYGELLARRVKAIAPLARLVIVVRDPVDRAYSHYNMTIDPEGSETVKRMRGSHTIYVDPDALHKTVKTMETLVTEDIAELEKSGIMLDISEKRDSKLQREYFGKRPCGGHGAHSWVGRGLYAVQLRLWLRHFPREQILIVNSDEMRNPSECRKTVNTVFKHVHLSPHEIADAKPKNTAEQRGRKAWVKPFDPDLKNRLREFFRPHNEEFFKLVGKDFGWNDK